MALGDKLRHRALCLAGGCEYTFYELFTGNEVDDATGAVELVQSMGVGHETL